MSSISITDLVAWYGAVLATFVASFELWKWVHSRALLRVTIRPSVYYEDSEVLKVEKLENGESRELQSYFHIEITNSGELPTTLLSVFATTKSTNSFERLMNTLRRDKAWFVMSMEQQAFTPHLEEKLPLLLGPGEVWSCRIDEPRVYSLIQAGVPKLVINAACYPKPLHKAFPLSPNRPANGV
jgi:hypothetical protein